MAQLTSDVIFLIKCD